MLLILTNSQDVTTDHLTSRLRQAGVSFFRFDTDISLCNARISYDGVMPILETDRRHFSPGSISSVWYRRPERLQHPLFDDSPEAKFIYGEWAEALEGFLCHIPQERWVNHPSRNVGASHKIEQLTTARALGFSIPDTLVTQDAEALRTFFDKHDGRIIVKPMARGYVERPAGKNDSLVYTNQVQLCHLQSLDDLSASPTLFQQCIQKSSDIRITLIDQFVHAVSLTARESDGSQRCDIRRNNMEDVEYKEVSIPDEVSSKLRRMMDHYKLRFAAIDMAVDVHEKWQFFEINPNGQWAWLDLVGCTDIARSFVKVFQN